MLKRLATDTAHLGQLSKLVLKHGGRDLVKQLGWGGGVEESTSTSTSGDQQPDSLTQRAEACARDIERLGAAYIKLAQIASTREDLLPRQYVEAFSRLQDDVEPVPSEEIEAAIQQGLGAKPETLFASFQRDPLATASIGQVHRAELRDGTQVVVKVRRPGIAEEATEQLSGLKRLAATVDDTTELGKKFRFRSLVGAVEYALSLELDYRQEANHLQQLAENLARFEGIRVPRPVPQMVCTDVLVMEYLSGPALKQVSGVVLNELPTKAMSETIVRAYLQQILVDGLFHADPHPGNLILHDGNRIGLLDGGMVVTLPPTLRREVGALLLAFSEGEGQKAAAIAARMSATSDDFDSNAYRTAASRIVSGTDNGQFQSMSLGRTLVEFLDVSGRHGVVLPFEIILLSKAFLQLETTLNQLDPSQDAKSIIRGYTFELLGNRASEQLSLGQLAATALDSAELAANLPSRLNEFTRLASENQLRFKVDAIDESELLGGLRKIANRIASGLIVAAMIVAAALMMRIETSTTLLGYPPLAIIFFLISASVGMVLIYQAAFRDNH